jgi:peptide chain release factor 2
MDEIKSRVTALSQQLSEAMARMHIAELSAEQAKLTEASQQPDFWNESTHAQEVMKQIAKLEARTKPWTELQAGINEVRDIINLNVEDSEQELEQQITSLEQNFEAYKGQLKLTGPYDDHDVIISIHAGAGGTDAQDWAGMLLRMYVRYAEGQGWQVTTDDESPGDEAGIKSVTLEIAGSFAYGKLKGEHGVHRLVRLSPFNADNLRQTSFAKVEVLPKIDQPDALNIDDKDLKIDVFRSGGHGGQSVNTTDSAVRITHLPTNIVVVIQNERSQLQNRETAMTILRSRLAQLQLEQHKEELSELKGPNEQASWGNQIRSYVLHPYKQVKDLRTRYETSNVDAVLDGDLAALIDAYLEYALGR